MHERSIPHAIRLCWLGLVPFIATTLLGLFNVWQVLNLQVFLVFSAVVLSFLGGIHWGAIMAERLDRPSGRLIICKLPPLMAWLSVAFMPPLVALVVLAFSYLLWLKYDISAISDEWYKNMRRPLTFVVVGCHFLWFITIASGRVVPYVT